ncbi:Uncharacterised protein [Yersinia pekkanenii]|uniref:Uncharacterized protein n=1 Tax=Yersinia pekkanenii TaxID=1288385 RepID=A0ABP1ZS27_9GAMM|nr:Uncharacterised protein [Yersinia pekkanenii]
MNNIGSVALTEQSQQKLHCWFFRRQTNKIVPPVINAPRQDAEVVFYVSCALTQYLPISSALAEMI